MHIGMTGTTNAKLISATAIRRNALRKRHSIGKSSDGITYGYEKRVEHDAPGDHIKRLSQIVAASAMPTERIFEIGSGCSPRYCQSD